jgi:membrane fusion protein (multidrug efflux system)
VSTIDTVKPRAMIKPIVIMAIAVAVVLGAVFGWQRFVAGFGKKFMAAAASAPQTVSTIVAAAAEWQPYYQSTGTARAVRGADLSSQASGVVEQIAFDSGNEVPAGKVLLRLNPNDDYAKLQQLQAAAELADQTLKRDQEQFAAQAVSQATLDTDLSTQKSSRRRSPGA